MRPNKRTRQGTDLNYMTLSFDLALKAGSGKGVVGNVAEYFDELRYLAQQPHTALMAIHLEESALRSLLAKISDEDFPQAFRDAAVEHRILHSPIRNMCYQVALVEDRLIRASPQGFMAALSNNEAYYLKQNLVQTNARFMGLEGITTALEAVQAQVRTHGFKIRALYRELLLAEDAFTPEQAAAVRKAVALKSLAGKTTRKQLERMMAALGVSGVDADREFDLAYGRFEWVESGDLVFTKAIADGGHDAKWVAERTDLPSLLTKLIPSKTDAIHPKHLHHHPKVLMALAQECGSELQSLTATHVVHLVSSPTAQGHPHLKSLLRALSSYRHVPEVHRGLAFLEVANEGLPVEELRQILPGDSDQQLRDGLKAVIRKPEQLLVALANLGIEADLEIIRASSSAFRNELGL